MIALLICAGLGLWLGDATGAALGAVVGAFIAFSNHQTRVGQRMDAEFTARMEKRYAMGEQAYNAMCREEREKAGR